MRLVSDNDGKDLARNRALQEVEIALVNLSSNMMRVVRGAGRPWEVGSQALALVAAMEDYFDVVGRYPGSHEVANALSISKEPGAGQDDFDYGAEVILRGALQIAASRQVGQKTQEAIGHNQLMDGMRIIERYRAQRRSGRGELDQDDF